MEFRLENLLKIQKNVMFFLSVFLICVLGKAN